MKSRECPVFKTDPSISECPILNDEMKNGASCKSDTLNPSTNMPFPEHLQQSTDPAANDLSIDRESSTIPRADAIGDGASWQYPSPRMFYNALKRKGKGVPAENIDTMLAVHNYLNEAVWKEVAEKEKTLHPQCEPKLKRFMGRPEDWSPTAWWHVKMRGGEPPFDRHDWYIDRCGCEVRYVIDYYSGHPESGEATFNVDIRPAIDTPQALLDRFRLFWKKNYE